MGHVTPGHGNPMGFAVESVETVELLLRVLSCRKFADNVAPDRSFLWVYSKLGDVLSIELIVSPVTEPVINRFLGENGPGLDHVSLEVAKTDTLVEAPKANRFHEVHYAEYDGWTVAFVLPRNPTDTLFQPMEFDNGYTNERGKSLCTGGQPVVAGGA